MKYRSITVTYLSEWLYGIEPIDDLLTAATRISGNTFYWTLTPDKLWADVYNKPRVNWKMELQYRPKTTGGVWQTIGSASGYAQPNSISNRQFNIGTRKGQFRTKIWITGGDVHPKEKGRIFYSSDHVRK